MATRVKIRRDTAANWASNNPVLHSGEFGYTTDTKVIKIGDGTTAWNALNPITQAIYDALFTLISDETTARQGEDAYLQGEIASQNAATLAAAQALIDAEASTRANDDSTLLNNINNVATVRDSQDANLQYNIDLKVAIATIVNDLVTGGAAVPLSAQQGVTLKALVDARTTIASIVNDLVTGGTAVPLSAQQGVALKALVDARTTIASIVNDLTTGGAAVPLSAQQGVALKALIDAIPTPEDHFIVMLGGGNENFADGTTYYFGTRYATNSGTQIAATPKAMMPMNGTLISANYSCRTSNFCSTETSDITLMRYNASNALINSHLLMSTEYSSPASYQVSTRASAALAIDVDADERLFIKVGPCPTWTTNPTQMDHYIFLIFKKR
jgi:hypothetical protein